jgi:signal peptidase II
MTKTCSSILLAASLVGLVGCDHATKYVAKAELEAQPAQVITPLLKLRYVENTDIAFNLLSFIPEGVRSPLLLGVGAVAVLGLLTLLVRGGLKGWALAGLLLASAGALGNYADRVLRGYVVDFIHVPHWPVFNVADVLICIGAPLMLIFGVRERRRAA